MTPTLWTLGIAGTATVWTLGTATIGHLTLATEPIPSGYWWEVTDPAAGVVRCGGEESWPAARASAERAARELVSGGMTPQPPPAASRPAQRLRAMVDRAVNAAAEHCQHRRTV